MYSPAEVPARMRAAPAKKRKWSALGGSSSERVAAIGLPVSLTSIATISSACASIASAMRSRASWRSAGGVSRPGSQARAAARTARAASPAPAAAAPAEAPPALGATSSARARPRVGLARRGVEDLGAFRAACLDVAAVDEVLEHLGLHGLDGHGTLLAGR